MAKQRTTGHVLLFQVRTYFRSCPGAQCLLKVGDELFISSTSTFCCLVVVRLNKPEESPYYISRYLFIYEIVSAIATTLFLLLILLNESNDFAHKKWFPG